MKSSDLKLAWPLIGNNQVVEFLTKILAKDNPAGSYIFAGLADLGKTTVANFFAQSLVCLSPQGVSPCGRCPACLQAEKGLHGDITIIKKDQDKKNISIEQIREFIRTLSLTSFLNTFKIGIIKEAESLTIEAFNALLKTLEEPKLKVVIILITTDLKALPTTIISRSQILRFYPVKTDLIYDYLIKKYQASRSAAKNFSHLSLGRPALAVKFFQEKEFYQNYQSQASIFLTLDKLDLNQCLTAIEDFLGRQSQGQEQVSQASALLDIWQGLVRDLILISLNLADLIQHQPFENELKKINANFKLISLIKLAKNLKQAKSYISANLNPKLVLENLVINI